jgi:hypothetical protein
MSLVVVTNPNNVLRLFLRITLRTEAPHFAKAEDLFFKVVCYFEYMLRRVSSVYDFPFKGEVL